MRRGPVTILTVFVLIIIAGFFGFRYWRPPAKEAALKNAAPITMSIPRGTIKKTMAATGTIAGARQAELGFALAGQVREILTQKGDYVEEGQILASMDSSQQELALLKAENALQLAKIEGTTANLREKELDLEIAKANLAKTQIKAPFAGLVVELALESGEAVQANNPALTLLDNSRFFVHVTVDELDVGLLSLGQKATVTVDALEKTALAGVVADIGWLAQAAGGLVTVPVSIQILEDCPQLRVGYSAAVEIETARVDDVLKLPLEAVLRRGNQALVTILRDGVETSQLVETGLTDGQEVEIKAGLREDDLVLGFNFRAYGQDAWEGQTPFGLGDSIPRNLGGFSLPRSGGFGR